MQDGYIFLAILAGFIVLFPLFWMAIVLLISRVGGWVSLARSFPGPQTPPQEGETFGWVSARFGRFANYNNVLNVIVSRNGIYMRPILLFRVGHAPILIPWHVVQDFKRSEILWSSYVKLTFKAPRDAGPTSVTFYGKRLADALARGYDL